MVAIHPVVVQLAASSAQIAGQRLAVSWPWYVIRAAGFVAAGLLILLMLSGIGQVTGLTYRFIEPVKAWAVHKALAFALVGSLAVHIGFLLIDRFVPFSLTQLLVPFASHYSNHTILPSLAVGFGVLAMYGIVIIVLSSLGWIHRQPRRWHALHYLSYLVALLVFLHALGTGSDLKYGLFRAGWLALGLIVGIGILSRLWRAGTKVKPQ